MNKNIMKVVKEVGFIITTNAGVLYTDKDGKCWLDWLGGTNIIGALFKDRRHASLIARKAKRQRPGLILWYKVIPVSFVIPSPERSR